MAVLRREDRYPNRGTTAVVHRLVHRLNLTLYNIYTYAHEAT